MFSKHYCMKSDQLLKFSLRYQLPLNPETVLLLVYLAIDFVNLLIQSATICLTAPVRRFNPQNSSFPPTALLLSFYGEGCTLYLPLSLGTAGSFFLSQMLPVSDCWTARGLFLLLFSSLKSVARCPYFFPPQYPTDVGLERFLHVTHNISSINSLELKHLAGFLYCLDALDVSISD